jgi:PDZ domain-containing secreted protein/Zn-dependent protease/CBS domain-containing protein
VESSFRIARVGGIEIGASWSWLIVFGIVVWSLATAVFPAAYPDLGAGAHLAMAVVTAVLFFASILLHELGHARRALREGVPIEGITLWLLGGVARIRSHPRSAGAAFRVAVMGPVITAALAVGLGILTYVASRLDLPDGVQGVLGYLTRINLIVLGFNLLPALPLDGGRIFQAWIWRRTGNPTEATVQAAAAGRVFGYLLVVIGLLGLFADSDLGGIWLVFVGWFLVQAAGAERTNALLRRTLGSRRVRDAMTPAPVTVPPDLPLDDFVAQAWQGRHSTYPVVADGELLGLVGVRDVSRVPPDERPSRRVGDIMVPRSELATIDADSELADVLDALDGGSARLPVLDGGKLVGILAPSDVAKAIEIGDIAPRDGESTAGRRRSAGPVVWAPVGLAFFLAAMFLYHPPFVVVEPGVVLPAEDDVTIEGATVTEVNGDYQLTAVSLGRANALGTLVAWVRPDREVIPIDEVIPPGVDPQEYDESQRELFDESRQVAAAAAAQAAGLDVTIDGDGATVAEVVADAPASGVLEPGDVIVAVNGDPVATAPALREHLRGLGAGTEVRLTVERAGSSRPEEVEMEVASLPTVAGGSGLGVAVTTRDLQIDLPFEISFAPRDIGGPSAGLAYALAITDMLEREDLAAGRDVAATGTISATGEVGPVGAVAIKAVAADDAGADLFLVPEREADDARRDDLETHAVRSLNDALGLLRTTA